jgi:hypothetical protein
MIKRNLNIVLRWKVNNFYSRDSNKFKEKFNHLICFEYKSKNKSRTFVKPISEDDIISTEENNIKSDRDNNNDRDRNSIFVKPKLKDISKDDKSNFKVLASLNDQQTKKYYTELRDSLINMDQPPNKTIIWFGVHSIPVIVLFYSLPGILWIHQVFWISTSMGLAFTSYEMYSSKEEKEILDMHMIIG